MLERLMISHQLFCFVGFLVLFTTVQVRVVTAKRQQRQPQPTKDSSDEGVRCDIFLAPSSDFGWGVYAGRDFPATDLVEIVPTYLPLPSDGVEIQSSILNDYVHTSGCGGSLISTSMGVEHDQLLLGYGSSYNHNDYPNVQLVEYPLENGYVIVIQALRNISRGEELVARYGDADWFHSRNIQPIQKDPLSTSSMMENRIPLADLPYYQSQYCSQIQAGVGSKTWHQEVVPLLSPDELEALQFFNATDRLASNDAGWGVVRAKQELRLGDRIEISLGLLVSQRIMMESILTPFLFSWQHLTQHHQRTIRHLRTKYKNQFQLHYPGYATRYDAFESYEDLAILPIGALAMVRRIGKGTTETKENGSGGSGDGKGGKDKDDDGTIQANCHLVIREFMSPGSTSLALELVATQPIRKGQVLLLDLPPSGTPRELQLLQRTLQQTGQPYHASTFANIHSQQQPREHDEL